MVKFSVASVRIAYLRLKLFSSPCACVSSDPHSAIVRRDS